METELLTVLSLEEAGFSKLLRFVGKPRKEIYTIKSQGHHIKALFDVWNNDNLGNRQKWDLIGKAAQREIGAIITKVQQSTLAEKEEAGSRQAELIQDDGVVNDAQYTSDRVGVAQAEIVLFTARSLLSLLLYPIMDGECVEKYMQSLYKLPVIATNADSNSAKGDGLIASFSQWSHRITLSVQTLCVPFPIDGDANIDQTEQEMSPDTSSQCADISDTNSNNGDCIKEAAIRKKEQEQLACRSYDKLVMNAMLTLMLSVQDTMATLDRLYAMQINNSSEQEYARFASDANTCEKIVRRVILASQQALESYTSRINREHRMHSRAEENLLKILPGTMAWLLDDCERFVQELSPEKIAWQDRLHAIHIYLCCNICKFTREFLVTGGDHEKEAMQTSGFAAYVRSSPILTSSPSITRKRKSNKKTDKTLANTPSDYHLACNWSHITSFQIHVLALSQAQERWVMPVRVDQNADISSTKRVIDGIQNATIDKITWQFEQLRQDLSALRAPSTQTEESTSFTTRTTDPQKQMGRVETEATTLQSNVQEESNADGAECCTLCSWCCCCCGNSHNRK